MMNKSDLLELGFKELPHPTIMGTVVFDLGRHRNLSVGCVGTPNEVMFLCYKENPSDEIYSDLVCVHNHDYDGYLTKESLSALLEWFKNKKKPVRH